LSVGISTEGNAVYGVSAGNGRAGFFEIESSGNAANALKASTVGSGDAIYGLTTGTGKAGLFQIDNTSNNSSTLRASTNGNGHAVDGFTSGNGAAIYGAADGQGNAVLGFLSGHAGNAGRFIINNTSNSNHALFATTDGTGNAGYFQGNVQVTGSLIKGSGSFKIDHPLDPASKYLSHSFVESPDMMNVYNGNVILDSQGEAWVELPDWLEALNRDFRYQLTAIGAPAPDLYVAEEISSNRFRVAGGQPGMKVSWQVTGIRQDPFANAHRIQVEEDKLEAEMGYYLHPELYGQPETKSVQRTQYPEMK